MTKGTPSFGNVLNVRVYSNSISLTNSIRKKLNINENFVLRYKFLRNGNISINKVSKVTRNKNNEIFFRLPIRKDILKDFNQPTTEKIQILDKKQLGYKPLSYNYKNKLFDLTSILDNKFTCFEEPNNFLTIYFLNKRATSIATVPRFIKTDNFCIWNIGFLIADGFNNNHRISISNSEYYLAKRFLFYLKEYWNVNESEIYVYIKIKPENYSNYVKEYWSNKLNINKDRIKVRKIYNKPPKSKYGNAEINVYNTAVALIHKKFVESVLKLIKSKEEFLSLIRGIEAGDGYVIEHNRAIEVGISSNVKHTELICQIFKRLGYRKPKVERYHTSENANKIYYKGINIARKFLLDNHFKEHKERRKNLIKLIRKFMKRDIKYLEALKSGKRTKKEIAEAVNVTYRAVNLIIRKYLRISLLKSKQIKIFKNNRYYNTHVFKLTKKGENLIEYLINKKGDKNV